MYPRFFCYKVNFWRNLVQTVEQKIAFFARMDCGFTVPPSISAFHDQIATVLPLDEDLL